MLVVMMAISCNNSVDDGSKVYYGEKFEENAPITPDELVQAIDSNKSVQDVQVSGTIDESCESSGCWITLKGGDDKTILVTYKDNAFTTAKKIQGKKVTLLGNGNYNEKKDEYEFVASGFILN